MLQIVVAQSYRCALRAIEKPCAPVGRGFSFSGGGLILLARRVDQARIAVIHRPSQSVEIQLVDCAPPISGLPEIGTDMRKSGKPDLRV